MRTLLPYSREDDVLRSASETPGALCSAIYLMADASHAVCIAPRDYRLIEGRLGEREKRRADGAAPGLALPPEARQMSMSASSSEPTSSSISSGSLSTPSSTSPTSSTILDSSPTSDAESSSISSPPLSTPSTVFSSSSTSTGETESESLPPPESPTTSSTLVSTSSISNDESSSTSTLPTTTTTSSNDSTTTTSAKGDSPSDSDSATFFPSASSTSTTSSATEGSPSDSQPATIFSPASTTTTIDTTSILPSSASADPLSSASTVSGGSASSASLSLSVTSTSQDTPPSSFSSSSGSAVSASESSVSVVIDAPSSAPIASASEELSVPASPAPILLAPIGASTAEASSPISAAEPFFSSTTFLANIITAAPPLSGSLFTTTMTYTSGGTVYTTTSTGVIGTGTSSPHDFAHNIGGIISVALACVVAVILAVFGVFFACKRFKPRAGPRRGFALSGAAKGLRRPPGVWRSPMDGESVEDLAADADEDPETSLLQGERSGEHDMAEIRVRDLSAPSGHLFPAHDLDFTSSDGQSDAQMLPLLPPSSFSIPGLISSNDSGRLSDSTRSSLLNPPAAVSSPKIPSPGWEGWRPTSGKLLPPREASDDPGTPEGLLRPSLSALQWKSSRSLNDHVDYSRLIGARRIESGNTLDTTASSAEGGGSS
ncbi:hypothetical protein B0H10DRAFT_2433450 [Mycena sp. CBHHK59/15]|nr:hypothetical protein B0H10DRAFT_2433450 [Mycena sp. CBHHK59/15]